MGVKFNIRPSSNAFDLVREKRVRLADVEFEYGISSMSYNDGAKRKQLIKLINKATTLKELDELHFQTYEKKLLGVF